MNGERLGEGGEGGGGGKDEKEVRGRSSGGGVGIREIQEIWNRDREMETDVQRQIDRDR